MKETKQMRRKRKEKTYALIWCTVFLMAEEKLMPACYYNIGGTEICNQTSFLVQTMIYHGTIYPEKP